MFPVQRSAPRQARRERRTAASPVLAVRYAERLAGAGKPRGCASFSEGAGAVEATEGTASQRG
jgi:hypothetical protein